VSVPWNCVASLEAGKAGVCFGSLVVTPSAGLDNRIMHMSYACAVIYHTVFFILLLLSHFTARVIPVTIRFADGRVSFAFCKNDVRLHAFDKDLLRETCLARRYNNSMSRNSLSCMWPQGYGYFFENYHRFPLRQRFPNCGPRTTSGPRVLPLWSSLDWTLVHKRQKK
jgi:hypothetical protein